MGFLDKAKAAAQEAQAKAKEGVADVQAKRDVAKATSELGEKTYELIESGQITNPELTAIADRIRAGKESLEEEPAMAGAGVSSGGGGTTTATTEPPPSDAPPAMPS
ncbi:MAG: hypothetical protein QOE36_3496 [Gaiellaceae bacterium]|jgi:hypothetical protein|nr:hypothetical protein [Gaiellaceae bacterium]